MNPNSVIIFKIVYFKTRSLLFLKVYLYILFALTIQKLFLTPPEWMLALSSEGGV